MNNAKISYFLPQNMIKIKQLTTFNKINNRIALRVQWIKKETTTQMVKGAFIMMVCGHINDNRVLTFFHRAYI